MHALQLLEKVTYAISVSQWSSALEYCQRRNKCQAEAEQRPPYMLEPCITSKTCRFAVPYAMHSHATGI